MWKQGASVSTRSMLASSNTGSDAAAFLWSCGVSEAVSQQSMCRVRPAHPSPPGLCAGQIINY